MSSQVDVSSLYAYKCPESRPLWRAWNAAIAKHLEPHSIPMRQVCGWPLVLNHKGKFNVVATPHFDVDGCNGRFYSAVFLAKKNGDLDDLEGDLEGRAMAVNDAVSCSGYLLPVSALGPKKFDGVIDKLSGSHFESCIKGKKFENLNLNLCD